MQPFIVRSRKYTEWTRTTTAVNLKICTKLLAILPRGLFMWKNAHSAITKQGSTVDIMLVGYGQEQYPGEDQDRGMTLAELNDPITRKIRQ